MSDSVVFIDFSNLARRALHSGGVYLESPDSTALMTHVLRMLKKIKTNYSRSDLVCVFDGKKATQLVRDHLWPSYKEGRRIEPGTPMQKLVSDLFFSQVDLLLEYLPYLGIKCLRSEFLEADLVIAAQVSKQPTRFSLFPSDTKSFVLSSDVDFSTMIREGVTWVRPTSKGKVRGLMIQYTKKNFVTEFGATPALYPYVKLLLGDKSDGVPGVRGWGKVKSAPHIIALYKKHRPKTRREFLQVICNDLGGEVSSAEKKLMLFDLSNPKRLIEFLVSKIPSNAAFGCFFLNKESTPSFKTFRNFCVSNKLMLSPEDLSEFAEVFNLSLEN